MWRMKLGLTLGGQTTSVSWEFEQNKALRCSRTGQKLSYSRKPFCSYSRNIKGRPGLSKVKYLALSAHSLGNWKVF
jgi:hypothetical protein